MKYAIYLADDTLFVQDNAGMIFAFDNSDTDKDWLFDNWKDYFVPLSAFAVETLNLHDLNWSVV